MLKTILEKGNDNFVSRYAVSNPNCPPNVLKKILERWGNDGVSINAAQNPNCPPDVLIKWMRNTGRIEKEDPIKGHIIQYDDKQKTDEDLQKLKDLVGKSNNWYKISQIGRDFWNLLELANNPNTSQESLAEIYFDNNNFEINKTIVRNPNCPHLIFEHVLLPPDNINLLAIWAISNKSCPSDVLFDILKATDNR